MGKSPASQQLPGARGGGGGGGASRRLFCERCSLFVRRLFSVKCCVFSVLSFAVSLSAFFGAVHLGYGEPGFDAEDSVKLRAIVQVNFNLQRPVSNLVPYIPRLEYDVNDEIGVPSLKVAVLSMQRIRLPNETTKVVIGFIPYSVDSTATSVSLSILKSTLIDLFLRQNSLALTSSIFGQPSSFEISGFPGGISIVPERVALIVEPLFTFVLNSSIYEITQKLSELKEQLKWGLQLMPSEVIYIRAKNKNGSTTTPPVLIEASVASDVGLPMPERLRQLAQIITMSPPNKNLGLDHSVFGNVKQVSLSSVLNRPLQAPPPSSSPSPAHSPIPGRIHDTQPPIVQSYPRKMAHHSFAPVSNPPKPSVAHGSSYCGSTHSPSPYSSRSSDRKSHNLIPHYWSPLESAKQAIAPAPG